MKPSPLSIAYTASDLITVYHRKSVYRYPTAQRIIVQKDHCWELISRTIFICISTIDVQMFCFTAPMRMIPIIVVPREKVAPILEKQPTGISLRLGYTRYAEFGLWHQCQDRGSQMFIPKCIKAQKHPKPVASVAVKRRCQLCRHLKMWHFFVLWQFLALIHMLCWI